MLVNAPVRRHFAAACVLISLAGSGCAGTLSNDETMAELERLRAAVRQSEERLVAMQAQQAELAQQMKLLSAFVGAMANEVATQKKQGFTGNAAAPAVMTNQPTNPPQSPDLEF